jgi:hypothetical protein
MTPTDNTPITPNIYLDIDGVLLSDETTLANHANEFLRKVLTDYPDSTYWLTTHCQGDATAPIKSFGHLFDPDVVELMQKIKPTTWTTFKTFAIDFSVPFVWFDNDLYDGEKQMLTESGALNYYVQVDLDNDPDQLAKFIEDFPRPYERQPMPAEQ